jgi:hypothetical protein
MKRIVLALVGVALASAASAVPQYSQLRQQYPDIDAAIAAAPHSDLNGTFGRLSALYNRSPIDEMGPDAGTANQLPANFVRNLEATLVDLQEDLDKTELSVLTPEQAIDLLAVVRIYAFKRPLELWQSNPPTTCPSFCPANDPENPCHTCLDDDPQVINEVQNVAAKARFLYAKALQYPGLTGTYVTPSQLTASNFIDQVGALSLTIKGVESIDD